MRDLSIKAAQDSSNWRIIISSIQSSYSIKLNKHLQLDTTTTPQSCSSRPFFSHLSALGKHWRYFAKLAANMHIEPSALQLQSRPLPMLLKGVMRRPGTGATIVASETTSAMSASSTTIIATSAPNGTGKRPTLAQYTPD
jgi:hypothetical protein